MHIPQLFYRNQTPTRQRMKTLCMLPLEGLKCKDLTILTLVTSPGYFIVYQFEKHKLIMFPTIFSLILSLKTHP